VETNFWIQMQIQIHQKLVNCFLTKGLTIPKNSQKLMYTLWHNPADRQTKH